MVIYIQTLFFLYLGLYSMLVVFGFQRSSISKVHSARLLKSAYFMSVSEMKDGIKASSSSLSKQTLLLQKLASSKRQASSQSTRSTTTSQQQLKKEPEVQPPTVIKTPQTIITSSIQATSTQITSPISTERSSKPQKMKIGAFIKEWPMVHPPETHFRRALRTLKSIKPDKSLKNQRAIQRKYNAQLLDGLIKGLTVPITEILTLYSKTYKQLHPYESTVANLTLIAREKVGHRPLTSILTDLKRLRMVTGLLGKDYAKRCNQASSAQQARALYNEGVALLEKYYCGSVYDSGSVGSGGGSVAGSSSQSGRDRDVTVKGVILSSVNFKNTLVKLIAEEKESSQSSGEDRGNKNNNHNNLNRVVQSQPNKKQTTSSSSSSLPSSLPSSSSSSSAAPTLKAPPPPILPLSSLYTSILTVPSFHGREASTLTELMAIHQDLRKIPVLDLSLPTVVLVGAPNVGKSSIVRAISSGTPEVNDYPFTTRGVTIGHMMIPPKRTTAAAAAAAAAADSSSSTATSTITDKAADKLTAAAASRTDREGANSLRHRGDGDRALSEDLEEIPTPIEYYTKCQVMDTPGLLDRGQDLADDKQQLSLTVADEEEEDEEDLEPFRNEMEKLTYASLAHLPTAVIFVIDPSGLSGEKSTLERQLNVRRYLKNKFPKRPWLDVISKGDLALDAKVEAQIRTSLAEDSINQSKQLQSKQTKRQKDQLPHQLPYLPISVKSGQNMKVLRQEVQEMLWTLQEILESRKF